MFDFRAYLKPKGANPEIDSFYYELSSMEKIHGMHNCEVLTLGFVPGAFTKVMLFRPIDPKKPIVFAVDGVSDGHYFIVVDAHTRGKKHNRMVNFKPFKTDDYIIACDDGTGMGDRNRPSDYWSIKTGGQTFVYGYAFPNTWQLDSVDPLCAFVAGEMTRGELLKMAWRQKESKKRYTNRVMELTMETGRQKSIISQQSTDISGLEEIVRRQDSRVGHLTDQNDLMERVIRNIWTALDKCWLPSMLRSKLQKLLDSHDRAMKDVNERWSTPH